MDGVSSLQIVTLGGGSPPTLEDAKAQRSCMYSSEHTTHTVVLQYSAQECKWLKLAHFKTTGLDNIHAEQSLREKAKQSREISEHRCFEIVKCSGQEVPACRTSLTANTVVCVCCTETIQRLLKKPKVKGREGE